MSEKGRGFLISPSVDLMNVGDDGVDDEGEESNISFPSTVEDEEGDLDLSVEEMESFSVECATQETHNLDWLYCEKLPFTYKDFIRHCKRNSVSNYAEEIRRLCEKERVILKRYQTT